ncbi:helix-turn-helix transcriptional regulator [Agaribacterium sp. ZY112]|uniref:helix-turn-helix transcriptional regulator n=1 Tax=Agaribacterium sp. ZY112 TaxID=3233574 RepID=UPI0035233ABC
MRNTVFYIPFDVLEFTILPLLSAQLLLLVLLYFSVFCRHILTGFYLHAIFLLTFSLYLVGQFLQFYTDMENGIYILFLRGMLFFGLGMPAVLIVLFRMSSINLALWTKVALYVVSSVSFLCILAIQDVVNYNYLFSLNFVQFIPFQLSNNDALILISTHMALLLLPLSILLWREWWQECRPMNVAFLLGTMAVPIAQLVSHHLVNSYWLIYVAAVFTAACWVWAVYYDVHRTRGEADAIKDELLWMLRNGAYSGQADELNELWLRLAKSSDGDILRYKLQVRELLSRLTELSIDAGADSRQMFERALASTEAISKSVSTEEVQGIATRETVALSGLIADLPRQRRLQAVEKARSYMAEHFSQITDNKLVAKHCGVSQGYLMRHFKELTGQTLNQYLTELRVKEAKRLLVFKTVTETAFEVGFNNSNYFSTVFKKVTGQTPGQYKQSLST